MQNVFQSLSPCFSGGSSDDFWTILQLPRLCHSVPKIIKTQRQERTPETKEVRSEKGAGCFRAQRMGDPGQQHTC